MKPRFAIALVFIFALRTTAQANHARDGLISSGDHFLPTVDVQPGAADTTVDTPPRPTYEAPVDYPIVMQRENLSGVVNVRFVVDAKGQVRDPIVISSTNPAFNQSVIDAVLKFRFEPALRHGAAVDATIGEAINFQMFDRRHPDETGDEPAEISDNDVDQSKLPPELRYDLPPKPTNVVYAVYPYELLRDGIYGRAEVVFVIGPDGKVATTRVLKATRPEFGQATVAMLDEWRFKPAMKDGKPTCALMRVDEEYSEYSDDVLTGRDELHGLKGDSKLHVPVSDEELQLLRELKKERPALCPLKDLDARPELISPHPPVFPSALAGKVAGGQAIVEFVIDHDGQVQLPRIVSASAPAFGYAAVQGVSAWKFAPPISHGRPVNVRARIPIQFNPPARGGEAAAKAEGL
ncbi:MAG: energy transducer TonB [Opitutaceae bacterium]|jgi:TonB family protein